MQKAVVFVLCVLLLFDVLSVEGHSVGAILNYGSRLEKEEKVAMEMAIGDINNLTNQGLVLHTMDSKGDPLLAASAGNSISISSILLQVLLVLFLKPLLAFISLGVIVCFCFSI